MKQTRLLGKLLKTVALTGASWLSANAQSGTWAGDAILDSSLSIQVVDQYYLQPNVSGFDSIVWDAPKYGRIMNQDKIEASYDYNGKLSLRKDGVWKYNNVQFKGIFTYSGDSLLTLNIPGADYSWYKDGQYLSGNDFHYVDLIGKPKTGKYSVYILARNPSSDTLYYEYGSYSPGVGATRDQAVLDQSILVGQTANLFSVEASAQDSVVWNFQGNTVMNQNWYLALSSGTGEVFVKKSDVWKKAYLGFSGIYHQDTLLSANTYASHASYQWFKNEVLIPNATQRSYSIKGQGNGTYTVKVTWSGSATGIDGKVGTYSYPIDVWINPTEVTNLIERDGLTFSVSNNYQPEAILWNYYYTNTGAAPVALTSTDPTLTITSSAVIRLTITTNGGLTKYSQKDVFGLSYDSLNSGNLSAPVIVSGNYTWYLNNTVLPDANGSTYVPKDTGVYKVVVTWTVSNPKGRLAEETQSAVFTFHVKTLAPSVVTALGNETLSADQVQVYPNPASGSLYIQTPNGATKYAIENLNAVKLLEGQVSNGSQIDISSLQSGVYYVHIQNDTKQIAKRIVVR